MALNIDDIAALMQCINDLWPLKYLEADGSYPVDPNQVKCKAGAVFPREFWTAISLTQFNDAVSGINLQDIVDRLNAIITELQNEPQIEGNTVVVCDTTTGDPFIVHVIYDEEAGGLSYIDQTGAAVNQADFTSCPSGRDYELKFNCYDAIATNGVLYTEGDRLNRIDLFDVSSATPLTPISVGWFNITTQTSIPAPVPADVEPCRSVSSDIEVFRLCDYNAATGVYTPFLRHFNTLNGVITNTFDTENDGQTAYVVTGTLRACPIDEVEVEILCDQNTVANTITRFIRRYHYSGGILDYSEDVTLDGSTPYVVVGNAIACPSDFEVNNLCDVISVTSSPVINTDVIGTNEIILSVDSDDHNNQGVDDIVKYEVFWGDGTSETFYGDQFPFTSHLYPVEGVAYIIDIIATTFNGNEVCYKIQFEDPTFTNISVTYGYELGIPFTQHVDLDGNVQGNYSNDYSGEYTIVGDVRAECPLSKCDRPDYSEDCCGEVCYRCFTTNELDTTNNIISPTDFGFYDTASADKWDETNAGGYWNTCDSAYPLTLRLDRLQVNNVDVVIPGAETLTINSESDLVIQGGAIKNVSDWLNNLIGVVNSGLHFENFIHRVSFPDDVVHILVQICELPCNGGASASENRKYSSLLEDGSFQYIGSINETYGLPINPSPFIPTPGIIGVADPFDSDDSSFYQIINNALIDGMTIPGAGLYRYDVTTSSYVQVGTANTSGVALNAAGYNPEDNFIYAIATTALGGSQDALGNTINFLDLIRVDRDGELFRVAPTALTIPSNTGYIWNGNLVVDINDTQLVYINVTNGNTIWNINITPSLITGDFVIVNDILYAVSSSTATTLTILTVDLSGTITNGETRNVVSNTIPLSGFTGASIQSGAAWVSSNPTTGEFELYANSNLDGDIVQVIGFENLATATAEVVATSTFSTTNDGANNLLAPSPFSEPEVGTIVEEDNTYTYEVDCIEQNKAKIISVGDRTGLLFNRYEDKITGEAVDPTEIEPCKVIQTIETVCDRSIQPSVRILATPAESAIDLDGGNARWNNAAFRDSLYSPVITPPVTAIEYRLSAFYVDGQNFATGQNWFYPLDLPRIRESEIEPGSLYFQRFADWLNSFDFVREYGIRFYDNTKYIDYNPAYPFFFSYIQVIYNATTDFTDVGNGLGTFALSTFGNGGYHLDGVATVNQGIDPAFVNANFTPFDANPFQVLN